MAKSTAYKILVLLDNLDDEYGFDQVFFIATNHVREHLKENYPEDFKEYEEDQQKEL